MRRRAWVVALLLSMQLHCMPAALAMEGRSPTTGLPTDGDYRPVLVQIHNSWATRPAWGLAAADIVYESVMYGPSQTCYLALYNDSHPESVGILRSTRPYWLDLRDAWDCPLVYSGGQQGSDALADEALAPRETFLFDLTQGHLAPNARRDILARVRGRVWPDNAVANLSALVEAHWPMDADGQPYAPQRPGLRFSVTPTQSTEPATAIDIIYDAAQHYVQYVYDPEARAYSRWYSGSPQADMSTETISVSNVIVQYVPLAYEGDERDSPVIDLTGDGIIDAFIDGRRIQGTWSRAAAADPIRYRDAAGNDLILLPGKTYVQLVPMDMRISFQTTGGLWRTASAEERTHERFEQLLWK